MISKFYYIEPMRRIVAIAIVSLLLSTLTPSVYALTSTPTPTSGTQTTVGTEEEVNADLDEAVSVTTKPRTATRIPTKITTPGAAKSMIMEKRKEAKEKFQAEREAFQEKLKEIKEIRKQNIVERVDEKINALNERHLTRLDNHLSRMNTVLEKIETKAGDATGDTTALDAAIAKAKDDIETAKKAVENQAGKEYIIEFDDETEIGTAVRSLFATFKSDMKKVQQSVKDAHKAVGDAAKALANLRKENKPTKAETTKEPETESNTVQ